MSSGGVRPTNTRRCPGAARTLSPYRNVERAQEVGDRVIADLRDADSDNDGLDDGEEVALGTDPNDEDSDDDGVCDGGMQVGACTASGPDNCPFIWNAFRRTAMCLLRATTVSAAT